MGNVDGANVEGGLEGGGPVAVTDYCTGVYKCFGGESHGSTKKADAQNAYASKLHRPINYLGRAVSSSVRVGMIMDWEVAGGSCGISDFG